MRLTALATLALALLLAGCAGPTRQEFMGEALTQYQDGKPAEASATFHRMMDHYPSDPDGLYYLGRIAQQQGDLAGAMGYYRACLDADPAHVSARAWLKKAEEDAGMQASSIRYAP